ncbi:hypothetical protein BD769DRAFT_72785 [Suillus cothurnatus]|nr:hypothetical protein BD769DRAFT_72785 [Suillus cothurnatus]
MTFSTDGKFFVTGCIDGHLYTWDLSAILKGAGLLSDIADATPRPAPKMKGTPRIPPGFFNDALLEANHHVQHILSPLSSFWRRSKSHRSTEQDGPGIQLREVEVPCTAGKPRNYHARKKLAAGSSRSSNTRTTQQHSMTTQILLSSQQLPPTANTSTLSAVPSIAEAPRTTSRPRITINSEFRARFMPWVCCVPIQSVDGY